MRTFFREVRLAARSLRKAPGFALGVIGALALGIGANTAIFGIANALLLRPLPVKNAAGLVHVSEWSGSDPWGSLSPPEFATLRERKDLFREIAASVGAPRTILVGGRPEELAGRRLTPEFLSLAGAAPILGRGLQPEDAAAGAPCAILVSSRLWQRRFGGGPGAIGQTVRLNNSLCEIVGVMPPDWERFDDSDFWMPYRLEEDLSNSYHFLDNVVARLQPGISPRQAEAALAGIASDPGDRVHVAPVRRYFIGEFWSPLLALIGAAGFVLLIACANVTNLLLARAAGRQRELAIRKALGASPADLAAHPLAESLLLAAAGAALALPLAAWGTRLLAAAAPADVWQLRNASLDWRVLTFSAVLPLAAAVACGLAPVLWAGRISPVDALRASRRARRSPFERRKAGGVLVVSEIALALPLIAAAGLMIQSLWRLDRADLGLASGRLAVSRIWLPRYKYPDEPRRRAFFGELLERLRRQPGVESAGIVDFLPVGPFGSEHVGVRLPGSAGASAEWEAMQKVVDGEYFSTAGIPVLRGRTFTGRDDARSEAVALVTESCARHFFPSGDAVGRRLDVWIGYPSHRWEPVTVVGVVGDVASWPEARVDPGVYLPYRQRVVPTMGVLVRSSSSAAAVENVLRRTVAGLDPDQFVETSRPLREVLAGEIAASRFLALLLAMFGSLALVLAATGTYAVMSSHVAQRRFEIGVRTALGAQRRDVVGLFVGLGLRWAAVGIALGAAVAASGTRLLRSVLYLVAPGDATTLIIGAAVLIAAGALGAYVPARRGARTDPMAALRSE